MLDNDDSVDGTGSGAGHAGDGGHYANYDVEVDTDSDSDPERAESIYIDQSVPPEILRQLGISVPPSHSNSRSSAKAKAKAVAKDSIDAKSDKEDAP